VHALTAGIVTSRGRVISRAASATIDSITTGVPERGRCNDDNGTSSEGAASARPTPKVRQNRIGCCATLGLERDEIAGSERQGSGKQDDDSLHVN
jgi:hypothetical protein